MKFADFDDEVYQFTSPQSRKAHYQKHVIERQDLPRMSEEEYERRAKALQSTPLDYKDVVGYISKESFDGKQEGRTAYVKYRKSTEEYVVYTYHDGVAQIVSYYGRPYREFEQEKYGTKFPYWDEIPRGM